MERERRTVALAALSLLMYGSVSFLGSGPFAFFPVNELAFFAIVVYFSVFNFKSAKVSYSLMLLFGALDLLNNQIFLSLFMDNEKIGAFYDNPAFLFLRLAAYALMLFEITRFYVLTKWKIAALTYPVVFIAIVAGVAFQVYSFQTFGLVVFVGMMYYNYKKKCEETEVYSKSLFYLWYFLAFLKLTTLLTIYLYDLKL